MKKLIFLLGLGLLLTGCVSVTPGAGSLAWSRQYNEFIGKRYEVVSALLIVMPAKKWGNYFLVAPELKESKKDIVVIEIPVGAVIVVDSVSRRSYLILSQTSYLGRFKTPSILKTGFNLNSLMKWKPIEKGQEATFKQRFAGMDEQYLKELP